MKKSTLKVVIGLNVLSLAYYMWQCGPIAGILLWTLVTFIWSLFIVFFVGPIVWLFKMDGEPEWVANLQAKMFPTKAKK